MQTKIKKSNAILGVLVIAFLAIAVSLVFELAGPSAPFLKTNDPTVLDVQEHGMELVSHAAAGVKSCSQCHSDAINNDTICIDLCHKVGGIASGYIPTTTWTGPGDSGTIVFEHHPGGTADWLSCLAAGCHEDPVEPDDARYAIAQVADHAFCLTCHDGVTHDVSP